MYFKSSFDDPHHEAICSKGAVIAREEYTKPRNWYNANIDACDDLLMRKIELIKWLKIFKDQKLQAKPYIFKKIISWIIEDDFNFDKN